MRGVLASAGALWSPCVWWLGRQLTLPPASRLLLPPQPKVVFTINQTQELRICSSFAARLFESPAQYASCGLRVTQADQSTFIREAETDAWRCHVMVPPVLICLPSEPRSASGSERAWRSNRSGQRQQLYQLGRAGQRLPDTATYDERHAHPRSPRRDRLLHRLRRPSASACHHCAPGPCRPRPEPWSNVVCVVRKGCVINNEQNQTREHTKRKE